MRFHLKYELVWEQKMYSASPHKLIQERRKKKKKNKRYNKQQSFALIFRLYNADNIPANIFPLFIYSDFMMILWLRDFCNSCARLFCILLFTFKCKRKWCGTIEYKIEEKLRKFFKNWWFLDRKIASKIAINPFHLEKCTSFSLWSNSHNSRKIRKKKINFFWTEWHNELSFCMTRMDLTIVEASL